MKNISAQVTHLTNRPFWAVLQSVLDDVVNRIALTSGDVMPEVSADELLKVSDNLAIVSAVGDRFISTAPRGTKPAVIPIMGVLGADDDLDIMFYGGTSYQSIQDKLDRAVNDSAITEILLIVDSPGGSVIQSQETADMLFAARQVKPVNAMVIGMAASAAYFLASQANSITLTPTGQVGSVGVRTAHVDLTKLYDRMGVKITDVTAGKYKTELAPWVALSDEAKAALQSQVDDYYNQFLSSVKRGRGTKAKPEMVADNFGEGRMFTAGPALAGGLVDKIGTVRDMFASRTSAVRASLDMERRKLDLA